MCEVEGEVPTKAVIDPPLSTPLPSKTLNTLLSSKYPAPQKTQHSTSLSLKTLNFPKKSNALDTPSNTLNTLPTRYQNFEYRLGSDIWKMKQERNCLFYSTGKFKNKL